jgi:hypothetical protein
MIVKDEIRTMNNVRMILSHFDVIKLGQKYEEREDFG